MAKTLSRLNAVRFYLQVTVLSDLCTISGTHLHPFALNGTGAPFPSSSLWQYPAQTRPSQTSWKLWRKFLQLFLSNHLLLQQPLGSWNSTSPGLVRHWHSLYDSETNVYYVHHQGDEWIHHIFNNHDYRPSLPMFWQPTPTSYPRTIPMHTFSQEAQLTPPPAPVDIAQFSLHDFETTLLNRNPVDLHFMPDITLLVPPAELSYQILASTKNSTCIRIVSGGGALPTRMAYGWVLSASNGTRLAQGAGPGYGYPTSHRAEGYGFLAATKFLHLFLQHHQLHITQLLCYVACCDNKGLLTSLVQRPTFDPVYPNYVLAPNWDLIEEIYQLTTQLPLQAHYTHVKGHQDRHAPVAELPLLAQLNVEADLLAGSFLARSPASYQLAPLLSSTQAHLDIGGITCTSHIRMAIRIASSIPLYHEYLKFKYDWSDAVFQMLDWPLLQQFMSTQPVSLVWSVKYMHNILNANAQGNNHWSVHCPKCPYCEDQSNHWEHQLICPYPIRRERTQKFIGQLLDKLRHLNTDPDLVLQIKYGLATWLTRFDLKPQEFWPELHHSAQTDIGWYLFLRGFWSADWVIAQQKFYKFTQTHSATCSGPGWAVSILTHIWQTMYDLWVESTTADHPSLQDPKYQASLVQRITNIQQYHRNTIPHDHFGYQLSVMDLHLASTVRLQNWIHLYASVIPLKCQLYLSQLTLQHSTILLQHVSPTLPCPQCP